MATIVDVAKKAGVSPTTVSRIINNRGSISEKTRKKVMRIMKEMNYQPNIMARSLQMKKSGIIGLIVPYLDHPFFSRLTESIENACYKNGYKLLICTSENNAEKEREMAMMLSANRVDGILVCSRIEDASVYADYSLPVVSIERNIDNIPSICCDNHRGGAVAAQRLIEGGCKNLLLFGNAPTDYLPAKLRNKGFAEECEKHGVAHNEYLIASEDIFAGNFKDNIKEMLEKHHDIDGIFCTGDILAVRALTELQEYGQLAPDNYQIIGFDGIDISDYFNVSTIAQPIRDMGEFALDILGKRIEGSSVPVQSILPVSYIKRKTTRA